MVTARAVSSLRLLVVPARYNDTISEGGCERTGGEIHRVVSVSFRHDLAFVRGNLHRPYGFGRNGTVFGVAPPHNEEHCLVVAPPNPVPLHSEI